MLRDNAYLLLRSFKSLKSLSYGKVTGEREYEIVGLQKLSKP